MEVSMTMIVSYIIQIKTKQKYLYFIVVILKKGILEGMHDDWVKMLSKTNKIEKKCFTSDVCHFTL